MCRASAGLCLTFVTLAARQFAAGAACESGAIGRAVAASDWNALEREARHLTGACSARGYYWQGVAQFNQNRFFVAVRSLRRSLELRDGTPAHLALAQAYAELNQRTFFEEELAAARKLDALSAETYYIEAKFAFERLGRPDLAEAALRRCLALQPEHAAARCLLAECDRFAGRNAEAEALLLRTPGSRAARLLAELYLAAQEPGKALEFARRAETPYLLAKAEWALRNTPAAIQALEQAIRGEPDDPQAHHLLAEVYRASGNEAAARKELDRFAALQELYGKR